MEIPQIKDKITARAFALALSVKLREDLYRGNDKYTTSLAKEFEDYIIGDAELPEVAGDPNMKILDMWSKLKENMEKSEAEMSKKFEELHSKTPFRANCHTEPKIEDIQNNI